MGTDLATFLAVYGAVMVSSQIAVVRGYGSDITIGRGPNILVYRWPYCYSTLTRRRPACTATRY